MFIKFRFQTEDSRCISVSRDKIISIETGGPNSNGKYGLLIRIVHGKDYSLIHEYDSMDRCNEILAEIENVLEVPYDYAHNLVYIVPEK